jgi:hypothetical protein
MRSVSHRLLRAEDMYRSQTSPCRICDVQGIGRKEFLSEYCGFALSESFLQCSLDIYLLTIDTILFIECVIIHIRAGQLQPTGGPHNSLKTRLRPALVSTFVGFFFLRDSPQWARTSSSMRFLDHTRHTTVGRTPLNE